MNVDLTLLDWIVAITPLVIVLLVGWFFVRRIGTFYQNYTDMMRRQAEALERIAVSLEKRAP
ncbi:hypothetical protein [Terricaulis sp.]|uniref:hypothetical protein n=1 Tax=Terricaulis sp. TaxID=2768686 RepID=UPI002AC70C9F|nr:hypothetical protein [Terricaulis sp.]MDZ4692346.1 hypothetical protein [Terricaulis sp.]